MLPLSLALKLKTKSRQANNDGTLTGFIMVLGSKPVQLIFNRSLGNVGLYVSHVEVKRELRQLK